MSLDPHPSARALRGEARKRGAGARMPIAAPTSPATATTPRDAAGGPSLVLALPWSLVLHDNHRFVPARGRRGLVASPQYRRAKQHAAAWLRGYWGARARVSGDLVLHARCFFPDRRKRDAGNYRKLITDALSGVVYADDSQLVSETWERAGFDRDRPRIEVTITVGATP